MIRSPIVRQLLIDLDRETTIMDMAPEFAQISFYGQGSMLDPNQVMRERAKRARLAKQNIRKSPLQEGNENEQ